MAVTNNRRISELTAASTVGKEDLMVIVQDGETKNAPKRLVSEENYTTTEKTKLAGVEEGANHYVLPNDVVHDSDITDVVRQQALNTILANYSLKTETGAKVEIVFNSSTYEMSIQLYDSDDNLLYESSTIDLPLETMVVDGEYDSTTKEIVLTLDNGNTIRFSVSDLVSGLVSESQLAQALAAYATKNYVDGQISAVNVTISSLSTKVDNMIVISDDETDATSDTEIYINPDEMNTMGTEVSNDLDSESAFMSPSIKTFMEIMGFKNIEWIASATYAKNKIVYYNSKLYKHKTTTNTSTTPDNDTTNWEVTSLIVSD